MLKLHFAVAEDEQTLLTVMTRGLATEVEVPPGKDRPPGPLAVAWPVVIANMYIDPTYYLPQIWPEKDPDGIHSCLRKVRCRTWNLPRTGQ